MVNGAALVCVNGLRGPTNDEKLIVVEALTRVSTRSERDDDETARKMRGTILLVKRIPIEIVGPSRDVQVSAWSRSEF